MRLNSILCALLAVFIGFATGCRTTHQDLKPKVEPEDFALPPQADNRYSNPAAYPKDTLYQGPVQKSSPMQGGQPRGMGMGPGLGGGPPMR